MKVSSLVEMSGKRIIMETLKSEGVKYIFGNPGMTVTPLLDELIDYPGMEYILGLHEAVASGMAGGYAYASGRPSVLLLHTTVGTGNASTNIFNACKIGLPIVVIAGRRETEKLIHEPTLEPLSDDTIRVVDQFTKWSWKVTQMEELEPVLRRAFKTAMDTPPGPIYLTIPRNIFEEKIETEILPPERYHVSMRIRGDPVQIRRAAELLAEAKRPVMVVGDGVSRSGAEAEIVELAELMASRVYSELNPVTMSFPTDHPLYLGGGAWYHMNVLKDEFQSADLIVGIGCTMFREYRYSPSELFPRGTKIIHMSSSPWEIAKSYPTDVGIFADVKMGLKDLIDTLKTMLNKERSARVKDRFENIKKVKEELVASREKEVRATWDDVPIKVFRLVRELREVLDDDAFIVDDAATSRDIMKTFFDFRKQGTLLEPTGGGLGWGMGAALGVKLALPEQQVVYFTGDGAIMYCFQGLWTAARYNIPLLTVICNNSAYMSTKAQLYMYGGKSRYKDRYIGVDLVNPQIDFVKLAEGMGVQGERVKKPDDLRDALKRGIDLGKPALIDVIVDPRDAYYKKITF